MKNCDTTLVIFATHPLSSNWSTDSSGKIWVTLGSVSSAFNTGRVFDKNFSVWFRMSSLCLAGCKKRLEKRVHDNLHYLQWIRFTQNKLTHRIARYFAFVQISTKIVSRHVRFGIVCILAVNVDMGIRRRSNFWWYSWRGFDESIVPSNEEIQVLASW